MTSGFDPFVMHNAESARAVHADAVKAEKMRVLAVGNAKTHVYTCVCTYV
jgi:hypothetical protein